MELFPQKPIVDVRSQRRAMGRVAMPTRDNGDACRGEEEGRSFSEQGLTILSTLNADSMSKLPEA
jgi:hypothetical protein